MAGGLARHSARRLPGDVAGSHAPRPRAVETPWARASRGLQVSQATRFRADNRGMNPPREPGSGARPLLPLRPLAGRMAILAFAVVAAATLTQLELAWRHDLSIENRLRLDEARTDADRLRRAFEAGVPPRPGARPGVRPARHRRAGGAVDPAPAVASFLADRPLLRNVDLL